MKPSRWFLPDSPDLLAMLDRQLAITIEGMDAFAAWAAGDAAAADRVRACEHRADRAKRDLVASLRAAFVTPLEPEDLFALSRGIDWLLNHAKDAIGESAVMSCPPDRALAEMAALLAGATRSLGASIAGMGRDSNATFGSTDAAIKAERQLEKVYRRAMAALLDAGDLREQIARRELYRRCSRIGAVVVDVAERIDYAIIKQS
jgi:uncharacterized protein Yka (UPF0111/DUF47 family)